MKNLWNDKSIEVVEIEGKWYALNGWNGEFYADCWQTDENTYAIESDKKYEIKPIYEYDEDYDQYDIVGYEII